MVIDYVKTYRDVQISEIALHAHCSTSTIRRDIKELAQQGLIKEVYGSVIFVEKHEPDVQRKIRSEVQKEAKEAIGKKAAERISDGQFVFLDAGSTTFRMIRHIHAQGCTFVTGGIDIATELLNRGFDVMILGGTIKPETEAVVGEQALEFLNHVYFDVAFLGTNGMSEIGYSTPDQREGVIKKTVIERSRVAFVVSDSSKKDKTASYVFATLDQATLISEK